MLNFFPDFNARLESAPFVAGDEFSAADLTTLVTVDFAANALKMPIPESHQSFRRWYESISSRPASSACSRHRRLASTLYTHRKHTNDTPDQICKCWWSRRSRIRRNCDPSSRAKRSPH
ncbi:glutathione binding-like protein [Paraburkholderia elongata]|uniref:glutathione binding-like protein n=1 Tax=Paraburkholderia elongata TaxID=2675747 RepID=UPI002E2B5E55|nr:glutathione binding-like protein [Paraburkholderia elongata]